MATPKYKVANMSNFQAAVFWDGVSYATEPLKTVVGVSTPEEAAATFSETNADAKTQLEYGPITVLVTWQNQNSLYEINTYACLVTVEMVPQPLVKVSDFVR